MQRHPALVPLSHDHQHGLAAALRLRRAAELVDQEPSDEATSALRVEVTAFLHFAARELVAHFEDEEQGLLPLLVCADPPMAAEVGRLALEHAQLRAAITRLRRASDADLARIARHAASLLHDHIRWEERELFETAQQRLSTEQLGGLQLRPREHENEGALELRHSRAVDGIASDQLNATPIDLAPDALRPPWVADRDVALVVVRERGRMGLGRADASGASFYLDLPATADTTSTDLITG